MPHENKSHETTSAVSRAAAHHPGVSGKSMPAVQAPLLAQLQADGSKQDVIQRVTVQSDWLKFERDSKPKTMLSSGSQGPWTECTDKTNGGYREAGETALGDRSLLYTLAKHKIIPAIITGSRNPYTRSHLIAAEFGGQLKFSPSDNIRYHPETLEYGRWQESETRVSTTAKRGFITTVSDDNSPATAVSMAKSIVDIIRSQMRSDEADAIQQELVKRLACTRYIPPTVVFRYTDVDDESLSFRGQWDGQDAGLQVLSVSPETIYRALAEAGITLPSGLGSAEAIAAPVHTIASRGDLVNLIKGFSCARKRKQTIINSLNKQFTTSQIDNAKFVELFKKLPEIASQVMDIALTADFHKFAAIQIEEVE